MNDNITLPRATVQQALEALLWADAQGENWQQVVKKAIKPIQEAAAQPEPVQEPFGYLWPTGRHPEFRFTQQKRDGADGMPLYTTPPQQQAEPVAWTTMPEAEDWCFVSGGKDPTSKLEGKWFPLYTTPPQRKPLTDEQDRALCEAYCNDASDEYFKARPAMDFPEMRRIFYAGHRKAWINYETAHGIKEGT